MLSKDLKKQGFTEWHVFSLEKETELLDSLPKKKGVYVIKYERAFGRFKGKSDIMGFGSSIGKKGGLRRRIRFYFHPGERQRKNTRICHWLGKTRGLYISWVTKVSDKRITDLEHKLRKDYEKEHGELPPWDRRE